jgi:hypothetical protein
MPNTTTSPFMGMPVPVVGVDPGPDWANDNNSCLSIIDSHNHTTGNGAPLSGLIPIGAVIPTFPLLTGAYVCSATTVADSLGYVQCAGQTLADASSPMNGDVIPTITGSGSFATAVYVMRVK